jgi:PAS domain S-box-containing protein
MQALESLSRQDLIRLLQESRQQLTAERSGHAAWYELSPVGFLRMSPDGRIVELNPHCAGLLGGSQESLLQTLLGQWIADQDRGALDALLHRVCDGESVSAEFRLRRVGCEPVREFRFDGRPWYGPDGTLYCLTSLVDITEHKQIARALQESEQLYRHIMQSLPAHIAVIDPKGRILAVNQAWTQFAMRNGADDQPGVAKGADYLEVCRRATLAGDTDAERALHGIEAVLAGGMSEFTLEYPCHSPEERRWYCMTVVPLGIDSEGGAVISHLDITQRKLAEQALRERSERYELIAAGTCDAIWDWDLIHHRVYFSPRWKEMRGYAMHEVGDREEDWSNGIHPEDASRVMAAVQDHFAGKTAVFSEEYRIRCKDGSWKWILDRGIALHDGSGRVIRMAGSESDITERKQTEAALRESESFYRQTLESIPGMVFTTRPDGDCVYVNRQWLEYTGVPKSQHLGEGWSKVVHPEDWSAAFTAWRIGCEDQTAYDLEVRVRRFDGIYEWFRVIGRPILDAEGGIVRWFGVALNIQRLKQAEAALRESEQRSRWALQAAGGGAWDWDLSAGEAWWSEEMYELWGVEPGTSMRLENSLARIVEADREAIGKALEAAIAERTTYHSEFRIRHPQRGERWMASQGRLVFDAEGNPKRLLGLTFDITQRKQAQDELARARRAAEQRAAELEALLQAVPAAVWIAQDRECRHISGNRTANTWLRLKEGEEASLTAHGDERPMHFKVYRHGRELRGDELPVQIAAQGIEVRDFEQEIHYDDGTVIPIFGNATPLWDEQGRPRGAVAAFVDISERKRAEQALLETDRRKDEFLAILAHELRNPLAPIRNAVEILKLQPEADENLQAARRIIDRQLQHMVRLIDDLLDVSRITRGRLELRKQRVDLKTVLEQAIETSRPQIDKAAHRLKVQLPSQPIYLKADPVRLAQVFVNLLNNACSNMSQGGDIVMSAQIEGSEAVVKVKDKGIGIPPEFMPHLFEMFSQVDRGLNHIQSGLGIGLSLAKNLVEMHGGRIEATSPGTGLGSEFSVRLPVLVQTDRKAKPARSLQAKDEASPSGLRILVVDDNRDAVDSLAMLLHAFGHEVDTAYDGLAGVEAAQRYRPDLMLLDIGMPRLDGYSACQRIREQPWGKGIRIIALTGWGKDDDRRKTESAGFDGHLVKPVGAAELQQILAESRIH